MIFVCQGFGVELLGLKTHILYGHSPWVELMGPKDLVAYDIVRPWIELVGPKDRMLFMGIGLGLN